MPSLPPQDLSGGTAARGNSASVIQASIDASDNLPSVAPGFLLPCRNDGATRRQFTRHSRSLLCGRPETLLLVFVAENCKVMIGKP